MLCLQVGAAYSPKEAHTQLGRLRGEVRQLAAVAGRATDAAAVRAALLLQGEAHHQLSRWAVNFFGVFGNGTRMLGL